MKTIVIHILFSFYLNYIYSQVVTDTVFIAKEPINLKDLNSKYDDYNSTWSAVAYLKHRLVFSTNRFSKGDNFDLIGYRFNLIPIRQNNNTFKTTFSISEDIVLSDINKLNTECNELGPYYIKFNPTHGSSGIDSTLFFITRDCNNNQDIFYAKYQYNSYLAPHIRRSEFQRLDFLNTSADEAYISISTDFKNIYYCSNASGDFDIYSITDSTGKNVYQIIKGNAAAQIENISIINSEFNDKCPYVDWNNRMVFCSDRKGGFGGYDLYYSIRKNGNWSEPINFGKEINSEFDEFRPILLEGRFMVFSSNRPYGLGGFDLYIVEIE